MTLIATLTFILCSIIAGAVVLLGLSWIATRAVEGDLAAKGALAFMGFVAFVCSFAWSAEVLFG